MNIFQNIKSAFTTPTNTSKESAVHIAGKAHTIRAKVMQELLGSPLASFELAKATGISYRSIQPRTSELRDKGLISDSGNRRTDPETGRDSIVWQLVKVQQS